MSIKDIALRNQGEIEKTITALEAEVDTDTACNRKTYAANCIRLDVARLQRDVIFMAQVMCDFMKIFDQMDLLIAEQVRMANAQDSMQAALANNVRVLRKLMGASALNSDKPAAGDPVN